MSLEPGHEPEPPLFAALQRFEDRTVATDSLVGNPRVQLGFDDRGAWLQVIDDKGHPHNYSPQTARGALRDLLKAMASIRLRQQELVGWEGETERIYLHEHEHVLWPLRNCPELVGTDGQPIENHLDVRRLRRTRDGVRC